MGEVRPQPRLWRLILAFAAAPWPIAALYAWWAASLGGRFSVPTAEAYFAVSTLVTYLPILLLGVPLHLILRHRIKPRLAWMVLSGMAIALVMGLAFTLLVLHGARLTVGTVVVRVDLPPARGGGSDVGSSIENLVLAIFGIGLVGSFGGLSGLTFWLVAILGDRRLSQAALA